MFLLAKAKTANTMEEIDDTLEAIYKKLDRSYALVSAYHVALPGFCHSVTKGLFALQLDGDE